MQKGKAAKSAGSVQVGRVSGQRLKHFTDTTNRPTHGLDDGIGATIREQRVEDHGIELVARAEGLVMPLNGVSRQGEITDGIQRLVADELMGETLAFRIDNSVLADGDGIFEAGAERKARLPEALDITHEAEGARACNLAAITVRRKLKTISLTTDNGAGENNLDIKTKTAGAGQKLGNRIAQFHLHRLEHLHDAARRILLTKANLIDRLDEQA